MFGINGIRSLALAAGLALGLGSLTPIAAAQDGGTQMGMGGGWGHRHMGRGRGHMGMGRALGLSDAQRAQAQQIRANARREADGIRATAPGAAQEQALRGLHERTRAQLRSILTPDQQARFDQMRQHRAERMNGMADRLQLSDAQRANVRTIFAQARTQAQAIHAQYPRGSAEARAAMQALRERTHAQVAAQLTPAQQAQLPHRR